MNGPFQVAQAGGTATSSTNGTPARIYKLTKPLTDQAVTVNLGYDQNVKIDFSAIANEKITLVHIGEKLIILFDNESTVTVEPFFKSRADGPGNDTRDEITVEMAPGRDISVKEFATLFPITTDASVLPAAGGNSNGNAQASGAYFSPFSVDPLDPVLLNKLAPQEELGNFVLEIPTGGNVMPDQAGNSLRPGELPPSTLVDLPTIALVGLGRPLVVDESFIPLVGSQTLVPNTPNSNRDSQDFAGSFTISAPAGVKSLTFALNIQDPITNLIDVATGQFVRLVSNGSGEVDGVITIDNTQITVFTLTVDGTGHVEFTVLLAGRQFVHSADVLEGISPNAGLVSLTATVTDNNGATASASIDLGPLITVHDDVPIAAIGRTENSVVMDESFGDRPANSAGTADANDTADDNVAGNPFPAGYGTPIGLLSNVELVNITATTGADYVGATTAVTLSIIGGNGADSLLRTTDDRQISLFNENGVIVGRVDDIGGTADPAGTVAFAISINGNGQVTVAQYLSLEHPTSPDNYDESVNLGSLINAVVTVTDGDGDIATQSIGIGAAIQFQDDGPTLTSPAPTNLVVNGDFAGGSFNGEGDFPNQQSWGDNNQGGIDTNGIEGWTVSGSGGQIERVGNHYLGMTTSNGNPMIDMAASPGNIEISQTVNGLTNGQTYVIQFEAGAPVPSSASLEVYWNGVLISTINPTGPMTQYELIVTGTGASGTLSFKEVGLDNADSVSPTPGTNGHHGTYLANISLVAAPTAVVDEDGLNNPSQAVGIGDSNQIGDAPTNSATIVKQALGILWGADNNDNGADGAVQDAPDAVADRSLTFANTSVTVGGAAVLTSNGDLVSFDLVDNGTRLVGYVNSDATGYTPGERLVFEVSLYDDATGSFTFTLHDNIDHAPNANENDVTLSFNYVAKDSDGDKANGSFTIGIDDDMPVVVASGTGTVDEDDLTGIGHPGNNDVALGDDLAPGASTSITGSFGINFGADGPAASGAISGVTLTNAIFSDGEAVSMVAVGNDWFGRAGARDVFKLSFDTSTGKYTFTLLDNLDHPIKGTEDNLQLNFSFVAKDYDLDSATGSFAVTVDDDMPVLGGQAPGTNLIQNGSFEQHENIGNPAFDVFSAIAGWTKGNGAPFEIQVGNIGDLPAQDQATKVELDSDSLHNATGVTNATIQQTVHGLTAGDTFELSFYYSPRPNDGNPDSSSFEVLWNGQVVHTIDSSTQADGWQRISITVAAVAGDNTVAFHATGQENTLGAYIDNVSLVPGIFVDEDGLPLGNHDNAPGDNVVTNSDGDNSEATNTGNLNIKWGADDNDNGADSVVGPFNSFAQDTPNQPADRSVTFTNADVAVTGVNTLTSHGVVVTYALNSDKTILIASAGDRVVFEVSLSDDGNGKFRFVLKDQLDHAPGNVENDIGLSFNFTATDSDGDAVSGSFVIGVDDDTPVLAGGPTVVATVYEDGLTNPNSGNQSVGNPETNHTATIFDGSLTSLVKVGADEDGSFSLVSQPSGLPSLTSKGATVLYSVSGDTLTAYVEAGGGSGYQSADREIFTLKVQANGSYTFTLLDQIDHLPNSPANDDGQTLSLNLSSAIKFTDFDGDSIPLSSGFTVIVEDDVPIVTSTSITRIVDEDDINTAWSQGTSPNDNNADGSLTEVLTGAAIVTGTLAGLVSVGADEPPKFGFTADAIQKMTALHLFSKESALPENGKELIYEITSSGSNTILTAYEPNPQGNPVFSLTVNTNTGAYEFRLFDELIHVAPQSGSDQNFDLRSGGPGSGSPTQTPISALDFGSIIKVTDADQDSVTLDGHFNIQIRDDVPTADIDISLVNSVTVDETLNQQDSDTTSDTVRDQFAALENAGLAADDPDIDDNNNGGRPGDGAINYARSNNAVVFDNSEIGADHPPLARQFSLSISDTNSGLFTTEGNSITLSVLNGQVIGTVVGGTFNNKVAFAIAIDSDGRISVAQYLSLKHPIFPNSFDESVGLSGKVNAVLTVTDSDGDTSTDSVAIGSRISFDDDGPSAGSNSTVSLEDDDLANGNEGGPNDDSAPQNEVGVLSHNYGADGPGATLLTGIQLPTNLGFTSIVAADGLSILVMQNGVDVLKIELTNATGGGYKVTQLHAIDHPTLNGQFGDDTENNLQFTVTYKVTDGDLDAVTGSLKIDIDDDTPEPTFSLQSGKAVVVDETAGLQNATVTPSVPGDANDNDLVPLPNPFIAFAAQINAGTPDAGSTLLGAPQYAQSAGPIVNVTPNYGADGPGSTVFSIDVVGNNPSTGLFTVDGKPISLFEINSTLIVGRYDGSDGNLTIGSNDPAAFAISIDPTTGKITVVQYVAIRHDDRGDFDEDNDTGQDINDAPPNDSHTDQQWITDSAITVTVAVTDHDGDTVDKTYKIGNKIVFEDDGPLAISTSATVVDEDNLTGVNHPGNNDVAPGDDLAPGAPVSVTGSFGVSFGADGPAASGAISGVALANALTSDGVAVGSSLVQVGNDWFGRAGARDVFKLSFDTSTGKYTFTLLDNLDHPVVNTEDNLQLNFTFVAKDGDLDEASGSFTVIVDDDMPVVPQSSTQDLLVNGDFAGGSFNGEGDFPNQQSWGDNNQGGIDTNGIEGWTVSGSGGQIERVGNHYLGMTTSNGNPMIDMAASPGNIEISQTVNGLTNGQTYVIQFEAGAPVPSSASLEVYWNGVLISTINPTGPMTQYELIVTGTGASGTLSFKEVGLDNADSVSPTPGTNGHHGTYLANISLVAAPTAVVDEDELNNPSQAVGIGDSNQIGDAPTNSATIVKQALGILWGADNNDNGADGAVQDAPDAVADRSLTFANTSVTVGGAAVLTSNGDLVSFDLVDNGTRLVGYVNSDATGYTPGERLVFEVSLYDDATGSFTFTLHDNIDHAPNANENDVTLSFNYVAKDSDGDKANGSFTIGIDDDMPVVVASGTGTVDEDDLTGIGHPGNNDVALGDDLAPGASTSITGSFGINFGADGPAASGAISGVTLTNAIFSDGEAVSMVAVGNDWFGRAGARDVFKLSFDTSTGKYTFTLLDNLDHPIKGTEDNLQLNFSFVAKDYDLDSATGSFAVTVDDDMPVLGGQAPGTNLIQNGSFEQHENIGNPAFDVFSAIAGWTKGNGAPFEIQVGNIGDLPAQDQATKVELDSDSLHNATGVTNATIQQTVHGLTAGDTFELSFYYSPRPNDGNPDSSSFEVLWNGQVVHTIDSSTQADGWQRISITVAAVAGDNTVAFHATGQENTLGAYIDNVSLVPGIFVDEDGLPLGNHDNAPGDNVVTNSDGDNSEATNTGNLNIKWGADDNDNGADSVVGPFNSFAQDTPNQPADRSVTFTNADVAVTGVNTLTSHGVVVTYALNSDKTILIASAGDRVVFEVSLSDDGNGKFRFVLKDQLDHAPGNVENDIGLSFNFTATDSDGDAVSGSFVIGVDDDTPVAAVGTGTVSAIVLDETRPEGTDTDGTTPNGVAIGSGTFSANFAPANYGADGPGTTTYALSLTGSNVASGLFALAASGAQGASIFLNQAGNVITGSAGGTDYFKITVNTGTGEVTFQQLKNVWHGDTSNDDDTVTLTLANANLLTLVQTVTDADGDKDTAALNLGTGVFQIQDDGPTAHSTLAQTVLDDEAQPFGINGGPGDDTGSNAVSELTDNVKTVSGTLNVDFGTDGHGSISIAAGITVTNEAGGTSGSLQVIYVDPVTHLATIEAVTQNWVPNGGGGGTLYGLSSHYSTTGNPAFTLEVDGSGHYIFTANAALNHPFIDADLNNLPGGTEYEDNLTLNFTYTVTDGDGDTASSTLSIKVDDDAPGLVNDTATVKEGGAVLTNVVFVLDVSGSMRDNPGVPGFTSRLALAKEAITNLLGAGNVAAALLVTFDSEGHFINSGSNGGWYTNLSAAANAVNLLSTGSSTDYDAALNVLMSNWSAPPAGGAQTIVYFLSDGAPNESNGTGSNGIVGAEETAWINFLNTHGISQSISVGIGSGVNASNLNTIAVPGDAIIVNDENDLISTIAGSLPGTVTGNVLSNDHAGADGFGHVVSITFGGHTYTYDKAGNDILRDGQHFAAGEDTTTLSVTTALNGQFTFQFTTIPGHEAGEWKYLSPQNGISTTQHELFTYVITDGDGDGDTAVLDITVQPSAVPSITVSPATQNVDEAGLPSRNGEPAGSAEAADGNNSTNNDVTTEAVSGTFTVTSADGLASITVDPDGSDTTVVVTLAQLLAANPGSPVLIETVEGKLAITGYNSATGVVSYTYTLEDNLNHSGGSVTDVFTITAADPNLDTSAPVTLTININDDAPTAKADTDSVSEGVGNFATGNVVTGGTDGLDANTTDGVADVPGADGFNGAVVGVAKGTTGAALVNAGTVGVNIVGDYGVLTLNANGTYSYNPNENLNNASGATDKFTYTIRDGDGDLSFTALTITINDGAVAATPTAVTLDLDEAALSTAGATGSNPGSTAEVDNAPALSFTAGSDNLTSFAFSGIGGLVTDLNGTGGPDIFWVNGGTQIKGYLDSAHTVLAMTLDLSAPASIAAGATGNVTVTATLSDNLQHVLANGAQISSIGSVGVVATDTDGDMTTGTVSINVKDDVPTARPDTDAVGTGTTATGNVITDAAAGDAGDTDTNAADTTGADGGVISAVQSNNLDGGPINVGGSASINGQYGTLIIETDGDYTYTRTSSSAGNDVFTYTLKDNDGDISTATLTLSLDSTGVLVVGSNDNDDSVQPNPPHTVVGPSPLLPSGSVIGGAGNDILVGDPGGTTISQGDTANIVLVLDRSGSMDAEISFGGGTISRLHAMKNAVNALIDNLAASGASAITVHIVAFDDDANAGSTFSLVTGGASSSAQVAAAHNFVNGLTSGDGTNYEAGLQRALDWINGDSANDPLPSATVNRMLFVSDGEPNQTYRGNGASNVDSVDSDVALQQLTGTYPGFLGFINPDNVSEIARIETDDDGAGIQQAFTIEAVGINVNSNALNILSQVEGAGGSANNITSAEQLTAIVGSLIANSSIPSVAGSDVINGTGGNDVIFGDVPFTDALAATYGLSTANGAGWQVFQLLEGSGAPAWSRTDTINYILTHQAEIAQESGRSGGNDVIDGGDGDDNIFGQEGNDTIAGGIGADKISGGSGNDIINGDQSDLLLDGGSGSDELRFSASFTNGSDSQISGIETVTLVNPNLTLSLSNQLEGFTINGTSGNDDITGGAGNDTIVSGAGNDTLNGGGGNDTFTLGTNLTSADAINGGADTDTLTFTDSGAATSDLNGVSNIESIILGAAATNVTTVDTLVASGQTLTVDGTALSAAQSLTWNGAAETNGAFNITGGAGSDSITGGAGNDRLIGGTGNDTLVGGAGNDFLIGGAGQDTLTGGGGNDTFKLDGATTANFDVITDFVSANDILNFVNFTLANHSGTGAINSIVTATSSSTNIAGADLVIYNVTADNADSTTEINALLNSQAGTFDGGVFVLAYSDAVANNQVALYYDSDANSNGGGATLVAVFTNYTSVTAAGVPNVVADFASVATAADPIVLDLDHNGVAFSSLESGVSFDINQDGARDQIAWTANGGDGILALDVDGSGKIESGKELFTPTFNGGHFADGIAALASLDGNHDGVINTQDQAFGDLVVWQDANHNGVSETGELAKLGDLGISSISLTTTSGGAPIDGQNIAGTGSFTYADGTSGTYVEVDLDASLGAAPAQPDSHPAEAHDLAAFAAVAAEIDHGGGSIDLSALHQGGVDHAPASLGQGGEAAHPGLDVGATTPAAIAIMHEQAALAMQLAAY